MIVKTWTAGLPKEIEEALVLKLKDSDLVMDRLSYILDRRLEESVEKQISTQSYDKASWPYEQADCNGYQRAMKEVLLLIKNRKN